MKLFDKLFKRAPEAPVVVVSGLPRSGTSMMMRMLEAGGLPPLTDYQRAADGDNPRGYYEFERVKKLREGDTAWLPEACGKVVKVISALLTALPPGYTYQVIFMRRAIPEVLRSQRQMLVNRGEDPDRVDDADMERYFEGHLAQVEGWLAQQKNIQTLYVDYNQVLADAEPGVRQVNAFLGGRLDQAAMLAAVDPSLYRQRASDSKADGSPA
jgi:hypothetical protein